MKTVMLALFVTALAGSAVSAQAPDSAAAGERVKLLIAADTVKGFPRQLLFGRLERRTPDSLAIRLTGGIPTVAVPRRAIDAIYVSRGVPTRKQSATGGAIGGAVVGTGVGLLMILVADSNFLDLLGHVAFDTALGAGLGWLMPQESWRRVDR